jgi:hypothetical protein
LCAACHAREPAGLLAWDRRDELGTLKAFWKTCIDLMLRPMPTLEGARPTGSLGSSLFFALLCSVTGYLMTGLFYTVVIGAMFSFLTPPATPPPNAMDADSTRAMVMGTFGIWTLLTPVFGVLATLISSCFDHLVLKLAGAQRSFEVTLRANALSQGPMLLGLIPFISLYVAPFWSIGLRVVTYRALHRTGWGTAVAGALAAPALLCVGCGGCYALLFMRMLHSLPTFPH